MKKKFSVRELLLAGVLLIAAVYYFVLHRPVSSQMELIEQQKTLNVGLLAEAEGKCAELTRMEKAVEESGASVSVPRYNNLNTLLAELHAILGSTASYSINFSGEEAAPPMVTRDVSIQCAVGSYGEVVEIVRAVHDCASNCVITELSWSDKLAESARRYGVGYAQNAVPGADAGRYSVSMEVRCYEYAG